MRTLWPYGALFNNVESVFMVTKDGNLISLDHPHIMDVDYDPISIGTVITQNVSVSCYGFTLEHILSRNIRGMFEHIAGRDTPAARRFARSKKRQIEKARREKLKGGSRK